MSITGEIGEFVAAAAWSDISGDAVAVAAARRSILDGLGLALAGSVSEACLILGRSCDRYPGSGPLATVLGSGRRVAPRWAALLNGVAMHAEDFDDSQIAVGQGRVTGMLMHPTAPVLPAALAAGESMGRDGRSILLAYAVGVEVACKIAEAIDPRHYVDGFHSSGTMGGFGAAAAVARLRGFSPEQVTGSLGLAASLSGGFREHNGTMAKPLQVGRAAEAGIVAADLVAEGFECSQTILEGDRGFFAAAGGGFDPATIQGRLGRSWVFAEPGIAIKPYPSGALSHAAMSMFARLLDEEGIGPEKIVRVSLGANRYARNALFRHRPRTGLEGKFSLEFCLASLALFGRAGLREFTDDVVSSPAVQDFIRRVEVLPDSWADENTGRGSAFRLAVVTDDGRTFTAEGTAALGTPEWPMSDAQLVEKFVDNAAWAGIPAERSRAAAAAALEFDSLERVDILFESLAADQSLS